MPGHTETTDQLPPAPTPAALDAPPLATLVTIDGVAVRVYLRAGGIEFAPSGNRAALVLDRFQAIALRVALGVTQ
jgi:hypothetical protein